MKQALTLGSCPVDEACSQVGSQGYELNAKNECRAFISQLLRLYEKKHGQLLPHGVRLYVKVNNHDFGHYYEVAVSFDDADVDSANVAYWLEENVPINWDDQSKTELSL